MKKLIQILSLAILSVVFSQCKKIDVAPEVTVKTEDVPVKKETVTDADGNVYNTIKMGNQVWMAENLKTSKFNDGTSISLWAHGSQTNWYDFAKQTPLYQLANTFDLNKVYPTPLPVGYYGAVYNHFALSSGKLAPKGWRIPTEQDFKVLEAFVASQVQASNVAAALKSKNGWHRTTGNGNDVFGFNGLPNGYVSIGGTSTGTEVICSWATSEVDLTSINKTRNVASLHNEPGILFNNNSIFMGMGVRCIKE